MVELISLVHLLILALVTEEVWLLELAFLSKIPNSFNSIPLVFTEPVAL
jgi:hypothetical protein